MSAEDLNKLFDEWVQTADMQDKILTFERVLLSGSAATRALGIETLLRLAYFHGVEVMADTVQAALAQRSARNKDRF